MKKLLTILIAILVLSMCFMTGCSDEEVVLQEDIEDATEMTFGENVALTAGDIEITMDELNIYIANITAQLQQYTGNQPGWEEIVGSNGLTAHDTIIEYAVEEARYMTALANTCIQDGLYTDEMDAQFYNDFVESCGGEEMFLQMLENTGFEENAFRKYVSVIGAYEAFVDTICSKEDAEALYDETYLTAKHILITFEGRESEDAALEEINAVYDRVVAGENFESLIDELGEDPGQDSKMGYTFIEGEMVDEFYQGTLALNVGEVSEPIRTDYGYHIIKRYDNPASDSAEYESYIGYIQSMEVNNYLTDEKTNSILENYPIYKNEDLLRTIDLSQYTDTTQSATE